MLTRMEQADFTWTYRDLWGGTKIGMDTHALRRSIGRFYQFMSFELLSSNIRDIYMKGGDSLEELVMAVPFGGQFVVFDEKSGLIIFADIDFNEGGQVLTMCLVHSLLVYGGNERKVYCEPDDSVFKVLLTAQCRRIQKNLCGKDKTGTLQSQGASLFYCVTSRDNCMAYSRSRTRRFSSPSWWALSTSKRWGSFPAK